MEDRLEQGATLWGGANGSGTPTEPLTTESACRNMG